MFKFSKDEIAKYREVEPKWGPVGLVTYKRTYARPKYENEIQCDTETWLETCTRVIEGNMDILPNDPTATREWALLALDLMYNMAWLPPGRGLWMMGTDYARYRGGDALNNCWYISVKPQSYEDMEMFKDTYVFSKPSIPMPSFPFVFMFDRAMLGGGVGFGSSKKNVDQYPVVTNNVKLKILLDADHPDWDRIQKSEEYSRIHEYLVPIHQQLQVSKSYEPDVDCQNVIKIQDSREGWDIAVRELIDAHWYNKEGSDISLLLDLSEIRGYGVLIKGFGGTASGPLSLIDALVYINKILNSKAGNKLKSVDTVDIMNILGRCVVSGNVRRTALIALGDPDDSDYVNAKNFAMVDPIVDRTYGEYGWYKNEWGRTTQKLKPYDEIVKAVGSKEKAEYLIDVFYKQENHRWASNNSVYTTEVFEDFHFIAAGIISNGEPGIGNRWLMENFGRIKDGFQEAIDADAEGLNPCAEITLENGEPCNLAEVIPYVCLRDGYNVADALRVATMYTYRITFAKYSWAVTQRVIEKNRRIGVSLTGMQDYLLAKYDHYAVKGFEDGDITKPIFHHEIVDELDGWYKYVVYINDLHAESLGENSAKKKTTCKPSGTVAKLPGVSSGIHWHYSPYLIQRIRFHETDPNLAAMGVCGFPIEKDFKVPNTMVVEFPVKAPNADHPNFKSANSVSLEEQIANQYLFAYAWADNAVSATLTFQQDEVDKIEPLLRAYKNKIKSTSLLPYAGHGYTQAPWEPITREEYERRVGEIQVPMEEAYKYLKITDMMEMLDSDCATGQCPVR